MHYLEKNELHHIAGGMSREDAIRLAAEIKKAREAGLPWTIKDGKNQWIFK